MTFHESPRFPVDISAGSKFGPGYSTSIARNFGGFEANNRNWSMPLHEGDVSFGCRTQVQFDNLLAFFHAMAAMHDGFRFKNFSDFQVKGDQGTVVALGGSQWQMYKTYTYGALSSSRKISKPVSGASISGGGTYSYSTVTGIITKTSGADPTGWVGDFDFPVRFNIDKMQPAWFTKKLVEITSIPIIEIRL